MSRNGISTYLVAAVIILLCIPLAFAQTFFTTSQTVQADIGGAFYYVSVSLLNQDPDPVEPGDLVDVRFKVENFGGDDLKDVTFEILPGGAFSLDNPNDAQVKIGSLFGRQRDEYGAILEWKLRVSADAVEGENEIELRYSRQGFDWITLEPFTIDIQSHDAIITVDSVKTTPERVESGNTITVDIMLENLADSLLKDIRAHLSLPENFVPLGSSDEHTVKRLDAGKTTKLSYTVMVDTDAESKTHRVPFELLYSDESGNKYGKNVSVAIVVDNPAKYVLNMEESTIYTPGKKGKLVVSYSDVGFSDINFVRVKLKASEAFDILSSPLVYLGNVEPDDYQTAEFEVFVHDTVEAGDLPVEFEVAYTDDYNRDVSEEVTLTIPLYSKEDAVKYGYEKAENSASAIIGAMFGILLLVFWLSMLVHVIKSKHGMWKKITWTFVIVTTLVLGAFLYYLFGRKSDA